MTTSSERPLRGQIWLAKLGAVRPGEPGKTRPVLVLTPEGLSLDSARDLVGVVPISGSIDPSMLNPQLTSEGLDGPSVAVVRGVRGLARRRLVRPIGSISRRDQHAVDQALLITLGLVRAD